MNILILPTLNYKSILKDTFAMNKHEHVKNFRDFVLILAFVGQNGRYNVQYVPIDRLPYTDTTISVAEITSIAQKFSLFVEMSQEIFELITNELKYAVFQFDNQDGEPNYFLTSPHKWQNDIKVTKEFVENMMSTHPQVFTVINVEQKQIEMSKEYLRGPSLIYTFTHDDDGRYKILYIPLIESSPIDDEIGTLSVEMTSEIFELITGELKYTVFCCNHYGDMRDYVLTSLLVERNDIIVTKEFMEDMMSTHPQVFTVITKKANDAGCV